MDGEDLVGDALAESVAASIPLEVPVWDATMLLMQR